MKKIHHTTKCFYLGGAKSTSLTELTIPSSTTSLSLFISPASKPKTTRRKRTASSGTIWNRRMNYLGHAAIATASISEHLYYSVPKLISLINKDEELFEQLRREQRPYKLKPMFRFSKDYWTSTISYGSSNVYF